VRFTGFAVAVLLGFPALAGATVQPVAERAAALIETHDYQGAATLVRTALRRPPGTAELWNLLGVCESELNHWAAARAAFENGLKLDVSSITLNENIGLLYFRQNEYLTAKKYLEKSVLLGSDNPGTAFSLATSQIRTGEPQRGLALLKQLEEKLAGQPAYWTERGWAEVSNDPGDAARSFDRAIALQPDDVRALNGASSVAEAGHDDEKALSFLIQAKKAAPDDLRTLLHFGSLCLRRDLTVDALEAIERAYKLAPSNNLALFLLARVQISFQQWQKSHDLFMEYDHRVPGYAPTHYALGWLDTKLNRPSEARKHLERSLALDPALVDARYELGQLDLDEGRLDDAETKLRAVLQQQPRHAKALVTLGDVLLRKGDLTEAKSSYEGAIEADANSGPAHYKLSTLLIRLEQPELAEQERTLGARLNAEATREAKTVLVLSDPEGRLMSGVQTKGER